MRVRIATVLLAFAFVTIPAFARAQGPGQPPPNYQQLAAAVAALTSQVAALQGQVTTLQGHVAKLEGNITAADLVGTYTLTFIDTPLSALKPGISNATIETDAISGTVTLNANGTLSFGASTQCVFSRLTQGSWTLTPRDCAATIPTSGSWSYSPDGTVAVTLDNGSGFQLNVGLGGRLAISMIGSFHVADQSSDAGLLILTRLR